MVTTPVEVPVSRPLRTRVGRCGEQNGGSLTHFMRRARRSFLGFLSLASSIRLVLTCKKKKVEVPVPSVSVSLFLNIFRLSFGLSSSCRHVRLSKKKKKSSRARHPRLVSYCAYTRTRDLRERGGQLKQSVGSLTGVSRINIDSLTSTRRKRFFLDQRRPSTTTRPTCFDKQHSVNSVC